ncbi:MAG: thrombospondin type 3 repeat-containing protein [Dehalococcoidia bacterium]|nr:thrombospondin type 3 repeat-containing protein [Dehalococcoidia bacterium]
MSPTPTFRLPTAGLLAFIALVVLAIGAAVWGGGNNAYANVVGADYTLDEEPACSGAYEVVNDNFPGSIVEGQSICYKVTGSLSVPTVGALQIVVNFDQLLVDDDEGIGSVAATGANCTFDHDAGGDSSVTCTFPGPLAALAQFTILITGVQNAFDGATPGQGCGWNGTFTAQDLSSAQGPQNGTVNTSCHTVLDFDVRMTKDADQNPYQTESFNYTIQADNDNITTGADDATITDTIPSNFTIIGGSAGVTTTGGVAAPSCGVLLQVITCTGVDLSPDAGVADTCPSAETDNLCINVLLFANANAGTFDDPPLNIDVASDPETDTATFTCALNGTQTGARNNCDAGTPTLTLAHADATSTGDTFSDSENTTIVRVGLAVAPTTSVLADGVASCTFTTDNWDNAQLLGSPSNTADAPTGDWNVTGIVGVTTTEGESGGNQTLTVKSTTAGTATVSLNWKHNLAVALAGTNQTPTQTCTFTQVTATFNVSKDFIPDSSAPVTVALVCTGGGTVVNDDTTAVETTDTADFTINNFAAGATCTATETVPAGYTNITGTACTAVAITAGSASSCTLTNRFNVEAALFGTAFAGGAIRHVDVDAASEDATWHFQNSASTLHPKGILVTAIDDGDDATTSLHTVCLFANAYPAPTTPALTDADWIITSTSTAAGAAGPPTTNNKAAVIRDFDFNDDAIVDYRANCVEWRSAQPGDQTIVLDLPAALEPPDKFYFDGGSPTGSQPLVKQWNFPQSTKIVGNAAGTFGASGYVGLTNLSGNTANTDVSNWTARDALTGTTTTAIWTRPNLDGSTITVTGSAFTSLPGPGQPTTRVLAAGTSFIDYAIGGHNDAAGGTHYSGPLDGVQQRYALSATSCGSVRLENPVTGVTLILSPGQSTPALSPPDNVGVWLSSDKGTAFSVVPTAGGAIPTTAANATCQPGQTSVITITSQEDRLLRTDRIVLPPETITVTWQVGPGHGKQPDLAWAQQRKLLEKNWRNPDGTCPYAGTGQFFYVRYQLQQQSVGALSTIVGEPAIALGQDFVVVEVAADPVTGRGNSDCISRVIAESQDEGEFDATAHVVVSPTNHTVISIEADFLIYYMKLEDITVGLVPGARSGHNSGALTPALSGHTNADAVTGMVPDDTTTRTANVSADVLARVRVRGWTVTDNCPVRAQGVDSNGGLLPANRCVFPDDWLHMMGGTTAATNNPQSDIWGTGNCGAKEAGPFSLLDPTHNVITDPNVCNDSKAPHVGGLFRETVLGNGVVTNGDAPVPSALVALTLTGSGFLRPAAKTDIYPTNNNTFYVTHLPSDPWIDVGPNSNYFNHWNTWGLGAKTGIYTFWTSLADRGLEVVSCGPASSNAFAPVATSPCPATGVLTGGYRTMSIFTDNHGEAMVWINGDANLTFTGCLSSASTLPTPLPGSPGVSIKTISGNFCRPGDIVGSSTVSAVVDYPDKHSKHYALLSNSVTVTWTWGGSKTISVTPSAGGQINRVQFNATDRDGFCSPSPSLHKVLGEAVTFLIDSGDGTIIVVSNNGIISSNGRSASTTTVRATPATPDICIAWVDILSTLFREVNVFITAFDPEGTVAFDLILNLDTDGDGVADATDNCPAVYNPDQADADGDDTGDACEADADGDGIEDGDDNCPAVFNPDQLDSNSDGEGDACEADSDNDGVIDDDDNCPTDYNPDQADSDGDGQGDACEPVPATQEVIWGDVDCSGSVTIGDAQKIARALIDLAITQAAGCTAINDIVSVTLDGSTRDRKWGDVDCSGIVSIGDAQKIARNLIDLPITQSGALCPGINETVSIPA